MRIDRIISYKRYLWYSQVKVDPFIPTELNDGAKEF